ncbi:MAG TPA: HAD family phosphatase [Rectinemataceae bacterium]|nr:HAD family phosphatase [Rectinemataceae bacterium]
MKEITTLLFDLGNVITKPQDAAYAEKMRSILAPELSQERFLEAYYARRRDYDRGEIDYRAYWSRVAEELGVPAPEGSFDELRDADLRSWFNIDEAMLDYVRQLGGKARHLVLLSNIHWDGVDYLESHFDWKDMFDSRVYSCAHKVNKPHAEIFRIALATVGARPENGLFVDDLAENIAGGRSAGLNAIQFFDLAHLRRELEDGYLIRS